MLILFSLTLGVYPTLSNAQNPDPDIINALLDAVRHALKPRQNMQICWVKQSHNPSYLLIDDGRPLPQA